MCAQGLRRSITVAINWPLWREGGMQPARRHPKIESGEFIPLDWESGLRIFETALRVDEPQIAGLLLAETSFGADKNDLPSRVTTGATAEDDHSGAVPLPGVVGFLKQRFATLTKIPIERIRPEEPLEKYGIDSLLVTTFTQYLEKDFGPLSKTLLFEYQTLDALGRYFQSQFARKLAEL